jgi:predicted  nucleic acid-binding Zn-ribbon protein
MTKDEIQAKLQEHLTSLQADLDVLQAKASEATDDLKVELDEQIANLSVKFSEAQVKFDQIKDAAEDALDGLIAEAETLWGTVSAEIKEEVEEQMASPTGFLAKIMAIFK